MITDEYKTALISTSRHPIYRIEWMDKNENVIDEITTDILDASISTALINGARRSCSLTINNNDSAYVPDKDGIIYLDKKFRLSSGLLIEGEEVFPPECIQGVFNIGNPIINSNPENETLTIEGYDNYSLLNGVIAGQLEALYIANIGEDAVNVAKSIFTLAGIIKSPLTQLSNTSMPYTMTKEPGSTFSEMLEELALMINYNVYFDANGRPNFLPIVDELTIYHSYVFNKDSDFFFTYTHNYNYMDVKNNIIVYGDNINGHQYIGEASDTYVLSPTSISRIGERTRVITDTLIYNQSLADARASYELKNGITAYEYVDINCLNIDFLKEGDVIVLNDTQNKIYYENYIIYQINRNLKFDAEMTITAYKVREVRIVA